MSLQYKKSDSQHSGDSFWTSYSDLFLGLSTIFLLLYVVSSLRTGADVIKQQVENQKLTMQVNDLTNQLKSYEDIKNQYMKDQATVSEKDEYNELMDKLSLLQEEAKDENQKLRDAMMNNQAKERSLNKYQQMVRNVLNANKLAKTKINTREEVIEEKSQQIVVKDQQVGSLQQEVQQKQQMIAQGEKQIAESKHQLNVRVQQLKNAYKANKISKIAYEKKMAQANLESQKKVQSLAQEKQQYQAELNGMNHKLRSVASDLNQTKSLLDQKTGEAQSLQSQLQKSAQEAQGKIAGLRAGYEAQKGKDRAEFEAQLNQMKLGAEERGRREAAYRAAAAQKEQEMNNKMSGLQGQLAQAKAEIEARKSVAQEIRKGFAKAGIKAEVDSDTGEVFLDFGQSYFDSDSARLKEEMKSVIEKAMPVYAQSLLGNPKVSNKVSAVEIIGFASPTYKGKFVDPRSTKPDDQDALKYNMDLSYQRAKSIFNYIVEGKNGRFNHQSDLMPLMKVSGRSFLEAYKVNRNVASEEFCKVNDCKKSQKVVIRFSMDQKK